MQEAAAAGLEQARGRGFFAQQLAEYEERRRVLVGAFEELGLEYTWPEGSYFVLLVSRAEVLSGEGVLMALVRRISRGCAGRRIIRSRPRWRGADGTSSMSRRRRLSFCTRAQAHSCPQGVVVHRERDWGVVDPGQRGMSTSRALTVVN